MKGSSFVFSLLLLLLPIHCLHHRQRDLFQTPFWSRYFPLHWPPIGLTRKTKIFNGLAPACLSSLISWPSPLGLCDPSMPAFHSTNTFTSLSPIAEPWHLLYHLFGMFFLHPLFFCLVNSYSCFRCQCKCYVLGEAFKPTYSLFVLIIWFAFLQNIYVSL